MVGVFAAARDVTTLIEMKRKLEKQALYDELTGLPNRYLLDREFIKQLRHHQRTKTKLAIIFIDVNDFKSINDTYGHAVGDEVLKVVSNRLSTNSRGSDIVSRLGGDEFVLLLYEVDATKTDLTHLISSYFTEPVKIQEINFTIKISIGVSFFPSDGETLDNLLSIADKRMYIHKKQIKTSTND